MVPINSPYREINKQFNINPVKVEKEESTFECPDLKEYYKNFGYNDSTVDHSVADL